MELQEDNALRLMAGHRLVEALRERDIIGGWQSTVPGEEIHPSCDRAVGSFGVWRTEAGDRGGVALP